MLALCSVSGEPGARPGAAAAASAVTQGTGMDIQGMAGEGLMWEGGWDVTAALCKYGSARSDLSNCFYSLEKLRSELSKFPVLTLPIQPLSC